MWLGRDSFVAADYINATITSGKGHNKWIMLENALFNFHKGDWRETSLGSVYIDCLPRTMRLLALGCSCRFGYDRYGSIQIRMLTYRGWLERPSQILEHRDTDTDTDTDMGCCVFCVHFQIFAASSSHLIHVVIPLPISLPLAGWWYESKYRVFHPSPDSCSISPFQHRNKFDL